MPSLSSTHQLSSSDSLHLIYIISGRSKNASERRESGLGLCASVLLDVPGYRDPVAHEPLPALPLTLQGKTSGKIRSQLTRSFSTLSLGTMALLSVAPFPLMLQAMSADRPALRGCGLTTSVFPEQRLIRGIWEEGRNDWGFHFINDSHCRNTRPLSVRTFSSN